MKRPSQDVAGRAKAREDRPHVHVVGQSGGRRATDSVSYCRGLYDPSSTVAEDAALLEDFADFLAGDDASDAELLPTPDPAFKERLRRRLWRTFAGSTLRGRGNEIH
jgi:hypothetical protein